MAAAKTVDDVVLAEFYAQVELAKKVLGAKGPLPWSTFLCEFEEHQLPKESIQLFKEACCKFTVPGLLCSTDFIARDTPKNTGLLKLTLIVAANQKLTNGKSSRARHFFVISASEEERECFGRSPGALVETISNLPNYFKVTQDAIHLRSYAPVFHESFFVHEDDPELSAVHKLSYFLMICHGRSNVNTAFEFCRCTLEQTEKSSLSSVEKRHFIRKIKSLDAFLVEGDIVSLPTSSGRPATEDAKFREFLAEALQGPGQKSPAPKRSPLPEVEVTRARVILSDKPLRWEDFCLRLGSSTSESQAETFQEQFFKAAPSGFLYSLDFIATDTPRNQALLKLQFVVVVDNKLGAGLLDRASYHFNVAGTVEERKLLGKNTEALTQTLQKHTDLFRVSTNHAKKLIVRPANGCLTFDSFFEMENKKKRSVSHKVKYFLNLCGGSSSIKDTYDFARSLLTVKERDIFVNDQKLLLDILDQEGDTFHVTKDEVKLRSQHLWTNLLRGEDPEPCLEVEDEQPPQTESEEDEEGPSYTQSGLTADGLQVKCNKFDFTLNRAAPEDHVEPKQGSPKKEPAANGGKKKDDQCEKAVVATAAKALEFPRAQALSEQYIRDTLKLQGYPMRWTEFQFRFMPANPNAEAIIADFQRRWSNKVSKMLICFSADFIALNEAFHRCRLKLQLILQIRVVATARSAIAIADLEAMFKEIASDEEIMQANLNCPSLRDFLAKFPQVFTIRGDYISQGWSALKFPTFFSSEQQRPLIAVVAKLKYFQNLCGGTCTDKMACKFLQRHICRRLEQALVDSEEKCMKLIANSRNFVIPLQPVPAVNGASSSESKPPFKGARRAAEYKSQYRGPSSRESKPLVNGTFPTAGLNGKVDSRVPRKSQEIYRILKEKMHPLSWDQLQSLCPPHLKKQAWCNQLEYLKAYYLPNRSTVPFIQDEDYIALNTPFARGFLKLCLLVRLIVERSGRCALGELYKLYQTVGSGAERLQFHETMEMCVDLFPSVFQEVGDRFIVPGPEMFAFREFFECKVHAKAGCHPCSFEAFMNICGGRCYYDKALNLMMIVSSRIPEEPARALQPSEFDQLVRDCKSVHIGDNSLIATHMVYMTEVVDRRDKTILKYKSEAMPGIEASSSIVVKHATSQHNGETSIPTPALAQSEIEAAPTVTIDHTKATAAAGTHQHQPSLEDRTTVTLHVIDSSETLNKLLTTMQTHSRPIISVACTESALIVVDWFGTGFILPVPAGDTQTTDESSAQWSSLWGLFQNVHLVSVIFDCKDVGRFLLEKLDLQLITVFDVKAAMELINTCFPPDNQCPCNSVAELCRGLGLPGPDKVRHQIVGSKDGPSTDPSLSEVIRKAGSLIPSVYSRIFSELGRLNLLKQLHEMTNSKLQSLYMSNMAGRLPERIQRVIAGQTVSAQVPATAPPTQNGTSHHPVPMGGWGSIVPAGHGSHSPVGSSHSSRGRPHGSAVSRPMWTASSFMNGLPTNSAVPVAQGGIVQSLGVMGGTQEPKLSQPSWMLPDLAQNGTSQSELINLQQVESDWFASVLEAELDSELERLGVQDVPRMDTTQQGATLGGSNSSHLTKELIEYYGAKNKESIQLLLNILGEDIKTTFINSVQQNNNNSKDVPTEIVLDVGRHAEARFHRNSRSEKPLVVPVSSQPITSKDLESFVGHEALTGFDDQLRCGIEGTLHSIRGLQNRKKKLVGLTIHVGLPLLGCADMMYDLTQSGKSVLILGYPRVGKTTVLRELARCLSNNEKKRVLVIDTYNEIAGDCDVAHFSIGSARRFQVPDNQSTTLLDSAKAHGPEVIIIDQLDSDDDVRAVAILVRRGIQIIAGTNRESFQSLLTDDSLSQIFQVNDLGLDDLQSIDSAGALASTSPAFDALVEMRESGCWYLHDLKNTLSALRAGEPYTVQERSRIDGADIAGGVGKTVTLREKVIDSTQR